MNKMNIYEATRLGRADIVKVLLNDLHIQKKFCEPRAAFQIAAENGNLEILKLLVNSDRVDKHGCSGVTCIVSERGHTECLKFFIEHSNFYIGSYSIIGAAQNGHLECLKLLLDYTERLRQKTQEGKYKPYLEGALPDPNAIFEDRPTPIALAAKNGHTEVVKFLLSKEYIDPYKYIYKIDEYRKKYHKIPLVYAAQNGHKDCLKLLFDDTRKRKPSIDLQPHLNQLSQYSIECIKLMTQDSRIDVELSSKLEYAVWNNDPEMVKYLLQYPEKIDPNKCRMNLICYTAEFGYSECLKLLLTDKRFDIANARELAIKFNNTECVKLLENSSNSFISTIRSIFK